MRGWSHEDMEHSEQEAQVRQRAEEFAQIRAPLEQRIAAIVNDLEQTRKTLRWAQNDLATANERAQRAEDVVTAARRLDEWPRRPYPHIDAELNDLHALRDALKEAVKAYDAAQPPRATANADARQDDS